MNIYPHIPYTYLIGWSLHNKYYYGVQYGKNANPVNLWKSYFTSSKYVKQMHEKYGNPDIIQIRNTFIDGRKARDCETRVLRYLKCQSSEKWLNESNNNAFKNTIMSDNIKTKISESKKGHPSPRKGTKCSDETKAKMSNAKKGKLAWNSGKSGYKNKPASEERKKKISDSLKGRPKTEEHCLAIKKAKQRH